MSVINFPQATVTVSSDCISLRAAVEAVIDEHFSRMRNAGTARSVGAALIKRAPPGMKLEEVTTTWLRNYVRECVAAENTPTTINAKLSFVSVLFEHHKAILPKEGGRPYKPEIPWARRRNEPTWWLTKEMEAKVVLWARSNRLADFADYVEFTTGAGLRVEENLRVQRCHFDFEKRTLAVMGTKTATAQRVIPLYTGAFDIAHRRLTGAADNAYLFDFSPIDIRFEQRCAGMSAEDREVQRMERNYNPLRNNWARIKDVFGWQRDKTATLKALRRSFAKMASDSGMPAQILQRVMGHSEIETTLRYLNVVGGVDLDVIRQWVT